MRRGRVVLAAALFLAAVAVTTVRIVRNLDVAGRPHEPLYGFQDFRDAFYYPSRALVDGVNPYDAAAYQARYPVARPTSPYAPHALVLHLPLILLPYRAAQFSHYALNLVLIVLLARACLLAARGRAAPAETLVLATVILLCRPTHQTLFLGQVTLVVVAGVYLALLEEERRPWLAAAGVALACMKPTYGVPLVVILLILGRRRSAARGILLAAAASLPALPSLLAAAGGAGPLVSSVIASYTGMEEDHAANAATSIIRLDVPAMLGRLAGRSLGPGLEPAIGLVILLAGGVAAARLARRGAGDGRPAAGGLACLTILVCIYHLAYDAVILALPMTALAIGVPWGGARRGARALRAAFLALLAVPAINYLATDTLLRRLDPDPLLRTLVTSANGAALAAAFVLALMVAFAGRAAGGAVAGDAGGPAGGGTGLPGGAAG